MTDPILFGALTFGAMLILLAIGIPVATSMGVTALAGMLMFAGVAFVVSNIETLPYAMASQYVFAVVPMFILMGALTSASGISGELYEAAYRWSSGLRGSLYYATTLAAGAFGAINGSSMVSAALFTRIALPEMRKFGFDQRLSLGVICAAGTFAAMIPPSVGMVIYAILAEASVGRLLIAGVIPGVVTVAVYLAGIRGVLAVFPRLAPVPSIRFTLGQRLQSVKRLWATGLLVFIVMGGIYTGIVYPSTAGAAGAAGALAIGVARRKLGKRAFWIAVKETAGTTASLFLILIGGLFLSRLLLVTGFVDSLVHTVTAMELTSYQFLFLVIVMYLVLGCFIDTVSLMVMTVPFLAPIAKALGIDLIWFGVLVMKLMELGAITPPVGLNLFAVLGAAGPSVSARDLYVGVAPFIALEVLVLALLIGYPELSLWLPNTMMGQ